MAEITEAVITRLVDAFYVKVRADGELGPIFDRAIGDNWDTHLATMVDFWSSVMLTSGRYKGNPVAVHHGVDGIKADLFTRWLELFAVTCDEELAPDSASLFNLKAARIADSLTRALYYRPEFDGWGAVQ